MSSNIFLPQFSLSTKSLEKLPLEFYESGGGIPIPKVVAFPQNSNPHIPGIPARDELCSMLNKLGLPNGLLL